MIVSLPFPFQHTLDGANLDQSCRQRPLLVPCLARLFIVRFWTHRVTSEIVCQPLQLDTGAPLHNEWLRVRLCRQNTGAPLRDERISVVLFPALSSRSDIESIVSPASFSLASDTTGAPLHDARLNVVFCPARS